MPAFERPCLVDVDTQVDFVQPSGALYVPGAERLIPIWRELTEFAESNHLPMIATVDAHAPDDPEFSQYPPHCVIGTTGQNKIAETLAMNHQFIANVERETTVDFDSQIIIEKQAIDVFTNVHAEQIFAAVPCSTFVVFGVTTEYCVRAAVLGLLSRGYRVHVVSDAVRALDQQAGERALAEMANAGAAFVQSASFLDRARQHLVNRAP